MKVAVVIPFFILMGILWMVGCSDSEHKSTPPVLTAPLITSTPMTLINFGVQYIYSITATGGPAPVIAVSGLPSWLSVNGSNVISGIPEAADAGFTGTITVTASNGVDPDAVQMFSIEVFGPIYVKGDAGGGNDGSSWTDAYTRLQDALAATQPTRHIWVAAGTYVPSETADRNAAFQLVTATKVYGGFDGTEESLLDRDWETNITVLSGDLNGDDAGFTGNGENSYTVVEGAQNAVLDGFTIRGGNADGSGEPQGPERNGGGMHNADCAPVVRNCLFLNNAAIEQGGGMFNDNAVSTIVNCAFTDNYAGDIGGGLRNFYSSSQLTDCDFLDNTADYDGGGMSLRSSTAVLTNCTFEGNGAANQGGGVFNTNNSVMKLTGCVFTGNTINLYGGGIFSGVTCALELTDCRFEGNTASAIYNYGDAELTNCIFIGNSGGFGGGMHNDNFSSAVLTNCLLHANTCTRGGGIYASLATITITNCTIVDNSASAANCGGGLYLTDCPSVSLVNSVIWDNLAGGAADSICNDGSTVLTISWSDVEGCGGSGGGWNSSYGTDGGGNLDADPAFTDPDGTDNIPGTADDDWHLESFSPCIDAGNNAAVPADTADLDADLDITEAVPYDLDGNPRCVDIPGSTDSGNGTAPIVDIGAYEKQN